MARKRAKKKPPQTPGAPLWMATFADIAILLLCFLVLILSFSTLDEPSFLKVTGSIRTAFGVQAVTPAHEVPQAERIIATVFETVPFEVREPIQQLIKRQEDAGRVTMEEDEAGEITIRIDEALAFESGRAELKDEFKDLLDQLGEILVEAQATMVVEGHTDNVPLRPGAPFSSNWSLSAARSVAVVEFLLDRHAIPRDRLAAEAYADSRPVAPNDTAEGRAANRRVEFRINPGEDLQVIDRFEDFIDPAAR